MPASFEATQSAVLMEAALKGPTSANRWRQRLRRAEAGESQDPIGSQKMKHDHACKEDDLYAIPIADVFGTWPIFALKPS